MTLNWADGDGADKTITVTVNDDALPEGAETVTLTLGAPTGGAVLGTPSLATLTISANDAAAGSLQFTPNPADQTVAENVGTATFTVSRTGGSSGAVSTTVTLGGTATLGVGFDYTTSALTLNWADGDGADKTITVTVNDDALPEGAETVTLTLGAPTGGAVLGAPSLATLTISANDAATADLGVTKTDSPDPVLAGANITYTIALTNNGPNDATTVALTDVLPANTAFVSLLSPGSYACTTPAVGAAGTVTCNSPTLVNGVTDNFTLVVQVGAATANGTIITNTATVASATTDANPANDTATVQTTVAVAGAAADLLLTKSDSPDPIAIASPLTYTLTVQNNGPSIATNVTLTDNLSASVTYLSASPGCTNVALVVTCSMGSIASGGTSTVTIQVMTTTIGLITNNAAVTATEADPIPGNNSASATTDVINMIPTLSPMMLFLLALALGSVVFTVRGMK
ncbi:MAG: DUF11 domain-containing protein [Thermoanaerobaculia bacterium]|nr:DUF11 domain-containing protein [Thermoanaerobaculia bacterium]